MRYSLEGFDEPGFDIQGMQQALRPKPQPQKKPGGLKGFLINSLPAIGGGIGAVAGIPGDLFSVGASSVGGAAVGGGLGETLKRKLLHESLDPKQIGIQALEGGATAAFTPLKLGKGITGAAKNFAEGGIKTATREAAPVAEKSSSFLKNLVTQGQAAQGRVTGTSAGKVGKEVITPQDTERMLQTFKNEGIKTGNANNTLRDIQDKMTGHGKSIDKYFTDNNHPLTEEDKRVISDNFLKQLPSTDPALAKQANILVDDFNRDVKDTKSMWKFRQRLDEVIPSTDQAKGSVALSSKRGAAKSMREYIADELGQAPGMKNYHDLSELKQLTGAEANRANNPSGGPFSRIFSSGPAQKIEDLVGKGVEKIGKMGSKEESPSLKVASRDIPLLNPDDIPAEASTAPSRGILSRLTSTVSPTEIARSAAAPLGSPGKAAGSVLKQEAARGFGIPENISQAQSAGQVQPDLSAVEDDSTKVSPSEADLNSPFSQSSIQKAIVDDLANNGGKNVNTLISLYKTFGQQSSPSQNIGKVSAQDYNLAQSGAQSIQALKSAIQDDPSILAKNAIPGGGLPIVGGYIKNAEGTGQLDALAYNIADKYLKLTTGATATDAEIKNTANKLMPRAGDSSQTISLKLGQLEDYYNSILQEGQSAGTGEDASDVLSGLGL